MFSDDINLFESHAMDGKLHEATGKWVGYNEHIKKEALKIILEIEATIKEYEACPMELKKSLEKSLQELLALF